MATSGAGFGASGFLQGFAQAYNAARVRGLQIDLEQRHGLASTLDAANYPNARPEVAAGRRSAACSQIYSRLP